MAHCALSVRVWLSVEGLLYACALRSKELSGAVRSLCELVDCFYRPFASRYISFEPAKSLDTAVCLEHRSSWLQNFSAAVFSYELCGNLACNEQGGG